MAYRQLTNRRLALNLMTARNTGDVGRSELSRSRDIQVKFISRRESIKVTVTLGKRRAYWTPLGDFRPPDPLTLDPQLQISSAARVHRCLKSCFQPPEHRPSQDFVWGALFFAEKVDDLLVIAVRNILPK